MLISDKRVKELEYQYKEFQRRIDSLSCRITEFNMRVLRIEENQPITQGIQFQSPFGGKFSFTFTMPDGKFNGGFCDDADSLPKLVEIVKEMGGTDLMIKDESIYMKVTKSSV